MNKIAVVYWSGTGNTELMAAKVAEGARGAGANAELIKASDFDGAKLDEYDAVAFGCPSMGVEQLEESEFEPMFLSCEAKLKDKKIALFGSYGWGDGEWMRDWTTRMEAAGATVLNGEGLICHETPDEDGLSECRELGIQLANA